METVNTHYLTDGGTDRFGDCEVCGKKGGDIYWFRKNKIKEKEKEGVSIKYYISNGGTFAHFECGKQRYPSSVDHRHNGRYKNLWLA